MCFCWAFFTDSRDPWDEIFTILHHEFGRIFVGCLAKEIILKEFYIYMPGGESMGKHVRFLSISKIQKMR